MQCDEEGEAAEDAQADAEEASLAAGFELKGRQAARVLDVEVVGEGFALDFVARFQPLLLRFSQEDPILTSQLLYQFHAIGAFLHQIIEALEKAFLVVFALFRWI